ncbi:MAG: methyltransferase domain-containing protein [Bacteroidales bacterium]|nr:methyltransferase domain-containing protein [Bacteroidales bacterium]
MNSKNQNVSRVDRTKAQAKKSYDRISHFYDYFAGGFERNYSNVALEQLNINEGETVLEIGFGTGHCLKQIAKLVGKTGKVYGIDISSGMLEEAKKRLEKASLMDRVELYCGDAVKMPYDEHLFDAVFMSFTLELFDTPEIPMILNEIKRVLKFEGRLGIVSMSKEDGKSILLKLYEWAHEKIPNYVDCRPIYVEQSLKEAGFEIKNKEKVKVFGLPLEIVVSI